MLPAALNRYALSLAAMLSLVPLEVSCRKGILA